MLVKRHIALVRLQVIVLVLLVCSAIVTLFLFSETERNMKFLFESHVQFPSAPAPAEMQSSAALDSPWILFAIPTVDREGDMLLNTLDSINKQLSDRSPREVQVLVIKNSNIHPGFYAAKEQFANRPQFRFVENTKRSREAAPVNPEFGDDHHPSWNVRQHSLDLVFMMEFAYANVTPSYFVFMEDDFSLCTGALNAIIHMLEKSNRYFSNWIGLLFGEGMNGIVLKRNDLNVFASYLQEHHKRRPPDHLIIEWIAGETEQSNNYRNNRPHIAFRYNLLQHRGMDSTLRAAQAFIPNTCYHINDEKRMFSVVSFKSDQCGHDDIWPCPLAGMNQTQTWAPPIGRPDSEPAV